MWGDFFLQWPAYDLGLISKSHHIVVEILLILNPYSAWINFKSSESDACRLQILPTKVED